MSGIKIGLAAVIALAVHTTASCGAVTQKDHLQQAIAQTAIRHGLPAALLSAVVQVESAFRTDAVSPKGAIGLMQLMPATASAYGLRRPEQATDPLLNLDAGARELRRLLELHKGNVALALASYNAGPKAVLAHGKRIPPYPETMLYVAAVLTAARAVQ